MFHWRKEWQTTSIFLPWEPHEQYEKAKRLDTESWTPQVGRCPLESSGEIIPERMKGWSQCKNNTRLWMWLVMEVKSNAVRAFLIAQLVKNLPALAGDPGLIPGSGRSTGEGIGYPLQYSWASLGSAGKESTCKCETWVWSLGWEDPLKKGKATHSSILAWRIPWTIQSMGSQRVRHNWVTFTATIRCCKEQ